MLTSQELTPCLAAGRLSPFETALLRENPTEFPKPRLAQGIAILTVLLFSLLYAPLAQTAEVSLGAESILSVLNQDRIKYDLSPLSANAKLAEAARAKAQDILKHSYFAHTSPAGIQPWDFIKNADFTYSFAGENLALNYTSAFELQNDFMNSAAHRENLLSPLFSDIGIAVMEGIYQGKRAVITVQMFGSPAVSTTLEAQ